MSTDELARAGRSTLRLLLHPEQWINRRVESVEFLDEQVARRQLSVDFRLPAGAEPMLDTEAGESTYLVPLTLMRRRSGLAYFDVRDENGKALPLMTLKENTKVSGATLIAAAYNCLDRQGLDPVITPDLGRLLQSIATREPRKTRPLLRALLNPSSREWHDPTWRASTGVRRILAVDQVFVDLAAAFARASVVNTPLIVPPGERRILKIAWDEDLGQATGGSRAPRLGYYLGLVAKVTTLDMDQVGGAQTHHVQIQTPPEVEMTFAWLNARPPSRVLFRDVFDREPPVEDSAYDELEEGFRRRAHIYLTDCFSSRAGNLHVGLRAERSGFGLGAALVSGLIAATLWLYVIAADSIVEQASSASAALLLFPGLLAAYVSRPGEHLVARSLRRMSRLWLAFDGFLAFVAAAALVALAPANAGERGASDLDAPQSLSTIWIACAGVASVVLAMLIAAWLLPRPVASRTS